MRHRMICSAVLAGALGAAASLAQQPAPRTTTAGLPAKVSLTVRGADAKPFLGVAATNADVRATLMDMALKADAKIVLDPSAIGTITGVVDSQPAEAAIAAVAKLAGLSVKKIAVPAASIAGVTPEAAGGYAQALTGLPVGALVSDAATGKTLVVSAAAPAEVTGQVVYFVHGRITPGGMRQRQPGQGGPGGPGGPGGQPGGAPTTSKPNQSFVDATAKGLQGMPLQERFDTLRALSQQMFQGLTTEEQTQLRSMGGGRGFGGRGGGGGRGNNGGGGGQGGPGGPNGNG